MSTNSNELEALPANPVGWADAGSPTWARLFAPAHAAPTVPVGGV